MKPINVGLLGIGTVGGGTWGVLARNREEIQRRAGREIRIAVVGDKDVEKAKRLTAGQAKVIADGNAVVTDPEIDIVVELIGGYTVAKDLVLKAIANGKHVVTANKALLARHGLAIRGWCDYYLASIDNRDLGPTTGRLHADGAHAIMK